MQNPLLKFWLALAATCVFCAMLHAQSVPPATTPPSAPLLGGLETLPEISWMAMSMDQSLEEERGAIILTGSAWVQYRQFRLEADRIVFFRETREAYAEGHIRLRHEESEISASAAYVDMMNQRGYLIDATLKLTRPGLEQGKAPKKGDAEESEDPDEIYAKATDGQGSFFRKRDPYGVYLDAADDPQARSNLIFKSKTLVIQSPMHYSATDALATIDDMADPLYGMKIGQLEVFLHEKPDKEDPTKTVIRPRLIQGKGARLKVGPLTLFPFPTVNYDTTKRFGFIQFEAGNSKKWGPYALFRFGKNLGGSEQKIFDPTRFYIDVDNRTKIGPALGGELKYQTGIRPDDESLASKFERGRGTIKVYGLYEGLTSNKSDLQRALRHRERRIQPHVDGNQRRKYDANRLFAARRIEDSAGPPQYGRDLYADNVRGMVDFAHHQPLQQIVGLNNVQLDFKYQQSSDRDFMMDYFSRNYLQDNQPEAFASARKAGDNYCAEIFYRGNPNGFDGAPPRSAYDFGTFTHYQPAFSYSYMPTELYKGIYLSGATQIAHLKREFDDRIYDQDDFDSGRIHGKMQVQRPLYWRGMNFRPHLGGVLTGYEDSRDGDGKLQGAMTYGLDLSSRIYGVFPGAKNEDLGVNGFRHIIEPKIEYLAVGDTLEKNDVIYDFDELDTLNDFHRIRFGLNQIFQTRVKRNERDVAKEIGALNLYMDFYPREEDANRLLDGDHLDLFHINGFLNVLDVARVTGDVGAALETGRIETTTIGLTIDPGGRWRFNINRQFNWSDRDRNIQGSDQFSLGLDFQLSERWGLSFQQVDQKRDGFRSKEGRQSTRVTLRRKYGPLEGSISYRYDRIDNDSGFSFGVAPVMTYRNLLLPADKLLVGSAQVDDTEVDEERNFDPFNLIRRPGSGKKPAPPPGMEKPRVKDVPAPPPADSTQIPEPTTLAEVRKNDGPAKPELKTKPKNLGADDWSGFQD